MIAKNILCTIFSLKHYRLALLLSILFLSSNSTLYPNNLSVNISPIDEEDTLLWQKFQNFTIKNLDKFIEQNQDLVKVKSVLYPFCGGDILYPMLIFTQAQEIILLSLEPIGITSISANRENKPKLSPTIVSLLGRSFMITEEMKKTLNKEEEGIYRIFIEQLSLLGIKFLTIDNFDSKNQNFTVSFTYKGLLRTISYYKLNLINDKFSTEFISTHHKKSLFDALLLKSTSYSLHQKQFSKIREFIIDNTHIIVQDDTGIPFQELEKYYNIKKLGSYKGPYGQEFNKYIQEDLMIKKSQEGAVPNCFGYGCGNRTPVVLIAKRKTY